MTVASFSRKIVALAAFGLLLSACAHAADIVPSYAVPGFAGRVNTVVTLCPSANGSNTAVACASGGGGVVTNAGTFPVQNTAVIGATSVQAGGTTSATINTFTAALAASGTRKGCMLVNTSANIELIFLGAIGSATTVNAMPLAAGATFNCASPGGVVVTDAVNIASGTASSTFVVVSQ